MKKSFFRRQRGLQRPRLLITLRIVAFISIYCVTPSWGVIEVSLSEVGQSTFALDLSKLGSDQFSALPHSPPQVIFNDGPMPPPDAIPKAPPVNLSDVLPRNDEITVTEFSPDGKFLFVGTHLGRVFGVELSTGKKNPEFDFSLKDFGPVTILSFSRDGKRFAVGHHGLRIAGSALAAQEGEPPVTQVGGKLRFFSVTSMNPLSFAKEFDVFAEKDFYSGGKFSGVRADRLILFLQKDEPSQWEIWVGSEKTRDPKWELGARTAQVSPLPNGLYTLPIFNDENNEFAILRGSQLEDPIPNLFDLEDPEHALSLFDQPFVNSILYYPEGNFLTLAVSSPSQMLVTLNVQTGKVLFSNAARRSVHRQFSPDGQYLLDFFVPDPAVERKSVGSFRVTTSPVMGRERGLPFSVEAGPAELKPVTPQTKIKPPGSGEPYLEFLEVVSYRPAFRLTGILEPQSSYSRLQFKYSRDGKTLAVIDTSGFVQVISMTRAVEVAGEKSKISDSDEMLETEDPEGFLAMQSPAWKLTWQKLQNLLQTRSRVAETDRELETRIQALIQQLNEKWPERESAEAELRKMGPCVERQLRELVNRFNAMPYDIAKTKLAEMALRSQAVLDGLQAIWATEVALRSPLQRNALDREKMRLLGLSEKILEREGWSKEAKSFMDRFAAEKDFGIRSRSQSLIRKFKN